MTAIQHAVDVMGSQTALAEAIGVKQQNVQYWVKTNKVPGEAVLPIEKATQGVVNRHELRPDLYPIEDFDVVDSEGGEL